MPSEVVTSGTEFRTPHHPSCISSSTHEMLCVPQRMVDCSAHDPGYGNTCYTRPEFVVTAPHGMPGVQDIEKHACPKHLGDVVQSVMRPGEFDGETVTVTLYEGA